MHCRNCGTDVRENARFCPTCGTPSPTVEIPADSQPTYVAAPPPDPGSVEVGRPRRRSWLPALLIVVVLAALVVGGLVLAGTGDDGPEISAGGTAGGTTPTPVDAPTTVAPATTTPTTTTPTTTTTTTTTTPATTLDPNAVALASLAATIDADRPTVDTHLGRWVPQISAKREGTLWEGVTYGPVEIDDLHQSLDARYGALLISGAEYNFRLDGSPMVGWYVSIVDEAYPTPEGALDWCRTAGIDRENCAAKLITNDPDAGETLVLQ